MNYYSPTLGPKFRFGDIVSGFVLGSASLDRPQRNPSYFSISIKVPEYSVILTPCCSVKEGKKIAVSPLEKIPSTWTENPYFLEDFTNINRTMMPELTLSETRWNRMPHEEQRRRFKGGEEYALVEFFVFPPNEKLSRYPVTFHDDEYTLGHYCINFKHLHLAKVKVDCTVSVEAKSVELSIDARDELRKKLAYYYSRVPDEDKPEFALGSPIG